VREQGLKRMGGTEVEPDERELPLNDGADLDQLEADRLAGGLGELGAGERQAPDRFHQRVGQAGKQQPPLVRPPSVGAHPVCEEHHLLLYSVLHLTAGAVALVVDLLRVADDVGEDEARAMLSQQKGP